MYISNVVITFQVKFEIGRRLYKKCKKSSNEQSCKLSNNRGI